MENKTLLEQQSPKIILKTANLLFILGIFSSLFIVFFSLYRIVGWWGIQQIPKLYIISFVSGVISILLFSLALRLRESAKANVALVIISSSVAIILSETYLTFKPPLSLQDQIPIGEVIDGRSKIQVIDDIRSTGIDAYPNVSGSQFISTNGLSISRSEQNIYPLGTISNKTTVYCNESGQWAIYKSDEHGFNNPPGLYAARKTDIILTGDSFSEGACVNPDETIAAVLRKLGLNVLSLGKGGNGPLLGFASLKEYAEPLQPKIVLWIHYANDIDDLRWKEMESSFLMKYLHDDDFSQNLILRQSEVDDVLKNYVEQEYWSHKIETKNNSIPKIQEKQIDKDTRGENIAENEKRDTGEIRNVSSVSRLIGILKLTNLRIRVGLKGASPTLFSPAAISRIETSPSTPDINRPEYSASFEFREILRKAREIVSKSDGKLYFVYLHAFERYSTGEEWQGYYRDHVLRIALELDIPIIDIHKKVFAKHPDPLSLFPGRKARHYNAKGYRLVAEAIANRLRDDGLVQ